MQTLTPAVAEEVQELAERLRDAEAEAIKIRKRLATLAERHGASAVAREAQKIAGPRWSGKRLVSRQSLEKRIAGKESE